MAAYEIISEFLWHPAKGWGRGEIRQERVEALECEVGGEESLNRGAEMLDGAVGPGEGLACYGGQSVGCKCLGDILGHNSLFLYILFIPRLQDASASGAGKSHALEAPIAGTEKHLRSGADICAALRSVETEHVCLRIAGIDCLKEFGQSAAYICFAMGEECAGNHNFSFRMSLKSHFGKLHIMAVLCGCSGGCRKWIKGCVGEIRFAIPD